MRPTSIKAAIRQRFEDLASTLDERQRRQWAAAEAKALGYGGITLVSSCTGVSRRAIHVGLHELKAAGPSALPGGRVRRRGAGGKRLTQTQPGLRIALDALVE